VSGVIAKDAVVFVTGANRGIGRAIAEEAVARGAKKVYAAARDISSVQDLIDQHPDTVVAIELDVTNDGQVAKAAAAAQDTQILINNAGVMNPPTRQETEDGFEIQIGTNHLGHFALTLLLSELLIATEGSRVVTVSSSAQNFGKLDLDDLQWTERPFKGMRSYGASKIANMLFTLELQRRFQEAGASTIATSAHPGWTATNLQKTTPLFRVLNPLLAMKPWQGALPTLYAAVAADALPPIAIPLVEFELAKSPMTVASVPVAADPAPSATEPVEEAPVPMAIALAVVVAEAPSPMAIAPVR